MNKTIRKLAYPYYGWLYLLAIVPIAIMLVLVFFDIEGFWVQRSKIYFSELCAVFGTINP